ncbi:MAG: hypothetical protein ACRECQ_07915, partial [Burkholderiaceae bacterium]
MDDARRHHWLFCAGCEDRAESRRCGEGDNAYEYFDKAWTGVLANLKKRFESGPQDWTEWMNMLRKMQQSQKK